MITLYTRRPTPTAIEYIVTTRAVTLFTPSFILLLLIKSILVLSTVFVALIKYGATTRGLFSANVYTSNFGKWVSEDIDWLWIGSAILAVIWVAARRGYKEETLLVLRGLGIQTTTYSSSYLSAPSSRFIPSTSLQDIFIHEGFVGFEVRFYLAAIVRDEIRSVVIFPTLLPRRQILEEVWRGSRNCLYDTKP